MTLIETLDSVKGLSNYVAHTNGYDMEAGDYRASVMGSENERDYTLSETTAFTGNGNEIICPLIIRYNEQGYAMGNDHNILLIPIEHYDEIKDTF